MNVAEHRVSRRDWNHGEARCPECRLRLSPVLDLDEHEADAHRHASDRRGRYAPAMRFAVHDYIR